MEVLLLGKSPACSSQWSTLEKLNDHDEVHRPLLGPFLSAWAWPNSVQGQWSWPSCTLSPCKEAPYVIAPKGTFVLAVPWGHCSGQCYHWVVIVRPPDQVPELECPLRCYSAVWPHLGNAGETVFWQPEVSSVSAERTLHVFILMCHWLSALVSQQCV